MILLTYQCYKLLESTKECSYVGVSELQGGDGAEDLPTSYNEYLGYRGEDVELLSLVQRLKCGRCEVRVGFVPRCNSVLK